MIICGGMLPAAAHHGHRIHAAVERQAGHEADHALLGVGQREDQLGEVVFEEGLAIGGEEGDGGVGVGRVAADQAEIADLAVLVEAHAAQSRGHRLVLGIRERLGIEDGKLHPPAGDIAVLLQQRAHALEVAGVDGRRLAEPLGEVEPQADRLVDGAQHGARAVRDREQALLRQVGLGVAQRAAGEQVDAQQQDEGQPDAGPGQRVAGQPRALVDQPVGGRQKEVADPFEKAAQRFLPQSAFFSSTKMRLANRAKAMSDT